MAGAIHLVKIIGAWACLVVGLSLAIFAPASIAGYLIGASVAFSLLPE